MVADQQKAQVVFWQQDLREFSEILRLVVLDPNGFGRGEACKDDIAGEVAKLRITI